MKMLLIIIFAILMQGCSAIIDYIDYSNNYMNGDIKYEPARTAYRTRNYNYIY